MIKQPTEKRNMTQGALEREKKHIDMLNQALGDIQLTLEEERSLIWLCGWETSTLKHVISAFEKVHNLNTSA